MTTLNSCKCPRCGALLAPEDMNVVTDVALCRACSHVAKLSELLQDERDEGLLDKVPDRIKVSKTMLGLEATYKSPKIVAVFMLFFTVSWNGILYTVLLNQVGGMGGGEKLFFVPFLLVGVGTMALAVYLLIGGMRLILNPGRAEVFYGIGSCGWRRKFRLAKNARVSIEESGSRQNGRVMKKIVVEQPESRPFSFGSCIADEGVLRYMAALLRQMRE